MNKTDKKKELICDFCGGLDFINEHGFFYCTECQTQSQEVQEHFLEQNEAAPVLETKVTVKKNDEKDIETKLTSWETYNYILLGLVEELLNIGANEKFKEITYNLWLIYLTKLEYMAENSNGVPKLSAVYRKRDAEIIFQKRFRKKRKVNLTSSASVSTQDMNIKIVHKEKRKQRKVMEKTEYDNISSTAPTDSHSLTNQTLSALTLDDSVSSVVGHMSFNKRSVKELLKCMSKNHLQRHLEDVNTKMTCHKNFRQLVSYNFLYGPENLTRNKLYCLIYLALLLSEQEFQISDLIRFCREGHLSFLQYNHFFRDENNLAIDHVACSTGRQKIPSYEYIRNCTFHLYKYLNIRPCNFSPNLLNLCKRYCTELNLPDEIYNIAGDYIFQTHPFEQQSIVKNIANYEGRVMGFIIYVLKVLLSFDDVTEYELSKLAHLVNQKNKEDFKNQQPQLFNFSDWFNYIEYRKIILKYVHFPTWLVIEPDRPCPPDLYIKFLKYRKSIIEKEDDPDLSSKEAKEFLNKIKDLQDYTEEKLIAFEPSLTPFRSYLEKLQTIENFKVLNQELNYEIIKDTSKQTIEYLIDASPFLKQIEAEKCIFILSNAHPKQKLQEMCTRFKTSKVENMEILEQYYIKEFLQYKYEQLALDTITNKILKKHIHNLETMENLEDYIRDKPKYIEVPVDKASLKRKNSLARNSKGRFCKKDDPEALPLEQIKSRTKGKWHISGWNKTIFKCENKPSLFRQVKLDEMKKEKLLQDMCKNPSEKHLNKSTEYKYHYIPRMEYCSNIMNIYSLTTKQWEEHEEKLPKNFRWLLEECARILEQSTKELFKEFIYVEVYMNYIYLKDEPFISKSFVNKKSLNNLKQYVKENW